MKIILTLAMLGIFGMNALAQNQPKVLIVIIDDVSESATKISRPNDRFLIQLSQLIQKKKALGVLAFGWIGNTPQKNFERTVLVAEEVVSAGLRLDKAAEVSTMNQKRRTRNHNSTKQWIQKVKKNAVKQTPDFSDVEVTFTKAEQLLREPVFRDFQKFLIFNSDLKNDLGKGINLDWKNNLHSIPNLTILGIGVHNPLNFKNVKSFYEIQSWNGVNQNLDYLIR